MLACKLVSSVNSTKKVASEDKSDVLAFRSECSVPVRHVVCICANRGYDCGRCIEFGGSLYSVS